MALQEVIANGYRFDEPDCISQARADYLGTSFSEMTTMQKGNRYYRNLTITTETKKLYAKEYGYDDETDFLQ